MTHTIMFRPVMPGGTALITKDFRTKRGLKSFREYLLKEGCYHIAAIMTDEEEVGDEKEPKEA